MIKKLIDLKDLFGVLCFSGTDTGRGMGPKNTALQIFSLMSLLFFCGCNVGPVNEWPDMDMPCEWHTELSSGMQQESPDCFLWWASLNDPLLNSLIERASYQNLDIYIAAIRILQAREEQRTPISIPTLMGQLLTEGFNLTKKPLMRLWAKAMILRMGHTIKNLVFLRSDLMPNGRSIYLG